MDHILDSVTVGNIGINMTSVLVSISPYIELIVGLLLAFYVGELIIMLIRKAKGESTREPIKDFEDNL